MWLLLAAAPMAIDVALDTFGVWQNTHFSRFATGVLLSAVAVFYIMPGLVELSLRSWKRTSVAPVIVPQVPENAASAPSDYSAPHRRI